MTAAPKIILNSNRIRYILVAAFIVGVLNLFFPGQLYAQKNLNELKEQVLNSPYVFSSILTAKELPVGKLVTLSNSVKRRGFPVAGKPVLILFDSPQSVIEVAGLFASENLSAVNTDKDDNAEASSETGATNRYRLLTDPKGNAVVSFTPREPGIVGVKIYFLNVPNDYVEHVEEKILRVFSASHLKATFWLVPGLLGGVFVLGFLFTVVQLFTNTNTKCEAQAIYLRNGGNIYGFNILFPWLGFLTTLYNRFVLNRSFVNSQSGDNGRNFFQSLLKSYAMQTVLVLFSIFIATMVYTSYTFMLVLFFLLLLLKWFLSVNELTRQPIFTKTNWMNGLYSQINCGIFILLLLWGFEFLFIREYSALEILPEYLNTNSLVWLAGLVLVVLAPGVWVGCWVLLVMSQGSDVLGNNELALAFHSLGRFWLDTVSMVVPEAQFWINQTGIGNVGRSQLNFLTEQFFYVGLFSIMISIFVITAEVAIMYKSTFTFFTDEKKADILSGSQASHEE